MDASLKCSAASELLALHARGELPDHEREQVESHLETCADCRADLEMLEEVIGEVERFAVVAPPAEMRSSVLATVEHLALAPLLAQAVEPPGTKLKATVLAAVEREPQHPSSSAAVTPLRPRRARITQFLAAAAVLVAGIVIGSAIATRLGGPTDMGGEIPGGHQTQVLALRGTGPSSAAVDHYRHDNFRVTLSVEGYQPTPSGFHYAVWVRGDSGDVSIGTFRLKRPDDFQIPFALGVNPTEYPKFVVTLEPNDGGPRLTGKVVTRGQFDPTRVHHGTYDD